MLRLLIFTAILTVIALSGAWVLDNNGQVTFLWLGYEITTSVAFLTVVVGAIFFALVFLLDLLRIIRGLPARMSLAVSMSKQERALAVITDGFTALAINDARNVRKAADRSRKLLGDKQPLTLLLSAEAARLEGRSKEAREYYAALAEHKQTEALGIKGLLTQALKEDNVEEAVRLAREAYEKHPKLEGVAPTLAGLYKRAGRWADALAVADRASRSFFGRKENALFTPQERARLKVMHAAELARAGHEAQAEILLKKAYDLAPEDLPVESAYAEALLVNRKNKKAEEIVTAAWKRAAHADLARVIRRIYSTEPPAKALKKAEKLLKFSPEVAIAHQLVGETALAADDLTKARNHLKLAMRERETATLCRLMAKLEEKSGVEHEQEAKDWHVKATQAFLEPTWVCSQCGRAHERWQMKCTACGALEGVEWDSTPRMAPAAPASDTSAADAA